MLHLEMDAKRPVPWKLLPILDMTLRPGLYASRVHDTELTSAEVRAEPGNEGAPSTALRPVLLAVQPHCFLHATPAVCPSSCLFFLFKCKWYMNSSS